MKPFTGFKAEKSAAGRETLPVGAYVAKILDAKEVEYSWGSVLLISFDITEGEHKEFFKADYSANTNEDKKWRGTYRLNIPKDDGTEQDGWSKNSFNNAIYSIEASNPGYHWDWNEAGLKGKSVGVLYRNFEWEINGRSGWSTECGMLLAVDDVHSENFKPMKDRPLKKKASETSAVFTEIDDSELPF